MPRRSISGGRLIVSADSDILRSVVTRLRPVDNDISTFLIADLSGYTALTEIHGKESAADAATELYAAARALAGEYGADLVKTLGDAVLLRSERADEALSLAARLVAEISDGHGNLSLRAGLDTAEAMLRDGEWFGAGINRAARVVSLADPGTVLLTAATLDSAQSEGSPANFESVGSRRLKNVPEPVELYSMALEARSAKLSVDPVCRMMIDPAAAAHSVSTGNETVYFCSLGCATAYGAEMSNERWPRPR